MRTPTAVIGDCILFQGDALEILTELEPLQVQALITDPPYCSGGTTEAEKLAATGMGLTSASLRKNGWFGGDAMTTAGLTWLLRQVAVQFQRHALDDSATATFCADWRMVPMLAPAIESAGLRFRGMPVWDKGNPGLGVGFRAQHECMLHYAIGRASYFNRTTGNVLKARRRLLHKEHPTEKPVDLMRALIDLQTAPGHTVLDCFMGSGSTGVAAVAAGRGFIGIERDPKHFDTACRRLEQAYADLPPDTGEEVLTDAA